MRERNRYRPSDLVTNGSQKSTGNEFAVKTSRSDVSKRGVRTQKREAHRHEPRQQDPEDLGFETNGAQNTFSGPNYWTQNNEMGPLANSDHNAHGSLNKPNRTAGWERIYLQFLGAGNDQEHDDTAMPWDDSEDFRTQDENDEEEEELHADLRGVRDTREGTGSEPAELPGESEKKNQQAIAKLKREIHGLDGATKLYDVVQILKQRTEKLEALCESANSDLENVKRENKKLVFQLEALKDVSSMNDEVVNRCKEAFDICDLDGSGTISSSELFTILQILGTQPSEHEVEQMINKLDTDRSGDINFEEFMACMSSKLMDMTEDDPSDGFSVAKILKIKHAFKLADSDEKGTICKNELKIVAHCIHPKAKAKDVEKLWLKMDQDGSGEVSWPEFVKGLMSIQGTDLGEQFNIKKLSDVNTYLVQRYSSAEDTKNSEYVKNLSFVERRAVQVLESLSRRSANPEILKRARAREMHVLTPKERRRAQWMQNWMIARAGFAGVLAASIGGTANFLLSRYWKTYEGGENAGDPKFKAYYYICFLPFMILASMTEVSFIYINALTTAMRISNIVGLSLWPLDEDRIFVASALTRAALGMKNPPNALEGVNPQKEIPRWKLLFMMLLFKAKVTLSAFILKIAIKRCVTRASMKSVVLNAYISAPVQAFWNMLVAAKVMREVRVRVMGASTVVEVSDKLLEGRMVSSKTAVQLLRAVALAMVVKADLHPNLELMFKHIKGQVEYQIMAAAAKDNVSEPAQQEYDSREDFLKDLTSGFDIESPENIRAADDETLLVLRVLTLALIIDGRIQWKAMVFFVDACKAARCFAFLDELQNLANAFRRGRPLLVSDIYLATEPDPRDVGGNEKFESRFSKFGITWADRAYITWHNFYRWLVSACTF